MLDHLYVDGTDLTTFGGYYFDGYTRNAPVREYTFYDIPGRNGSVLGPSSRLQNIEVAYDFIIDSEANLRSLRSFLMSREGYVRIEDSVHTTEYRMGVFEGPLEVTSTKDRDQHKGTIVFNCQPQRWLKSGETEIQFNTFGLIENFTPFDVYPLYRIVITPYTTNTVWLDYDQRIDGGGYIGGGNGRLIKTKSTVYGASEIYVDAMTMEVYRIDYNGIKISMADQVSVLYTEGNSEGGHGADPPIIPKDGALSYRDAYSSVPASDIYVTPRWYAL